MTSDAELSAYLDGELEPDRAAAVANLIANDDQVRAQYEALRTLDSQLRQVADAAAFAPRVVLPRPASKAVPWLAVLVPALPGAWLLAKLLGTMTVALAINGVALAALIGGLILLAASETAPRPPHVISRFNSPFRP